ncbi:MAG: adenine phosphoribosyltransferase [Christensenellales bacterium]|jgi:adenine phosphoribosyltransferase
MTGYEMEIFPDFPIKGVNFFDISSILQNDNWFEKTAEQFRESYPGPQPDYVLGIESRGLIYATVVSGAIERGLVMARKPGKLPGELLGAQYGKEYGKDRLEIQKSKITPGAKYLIVDDILATGNTIKAVADLITELGGEILGIWVYGEIDGLGGRELLKEYPLYSVVNLKE